MRHVLLAGGCILALAVPGWAYAQDATPPASDTPGYSVTPQQQAPDDATGGGKQKGGGGISKFDAANTSHDGRLTAAQALAGHMRGVAKHFDEIDLDHKGYITKADLRAYHEKAKAEGQAPKGVPHPG